MKNVLEASNLIPSTKVTGANVFDPSGESIGEIHDVVLDKVSGKVAFAIMSFGGFLGMGKSYHQVPWPLLRYDRGRDGYVVDLSKADLRDTPGYPVGAVHDRDGDEFEARLHSYYDNGPLGMI
jgi:sporulation protein YlmC with PRC-barrel domain